jgi:hypothetical protein
VISTLFNFYAMRRGTMAVGGNSPSLADDVRAMPLMIGRFIRRDPALVVRSLRSSKGLKTLRLTNCWYGSSGGIGTFYKALFEAAERKGHLIRLVVPGNSIGVLDVGRFGRICEIEARRSTGITGSFFPTGTCFRKRPCSALSMKNFPI